MITNRLRLTVWMTVELGGIVTSRDFYRAVKDCNKSDAMEGPLQIKLSTNAKMVLRSPVFAFTTQHREMQIVKVSLSQLGLDGKVSRAQIYDSARERGLAKCPIDVGPLSRLRCLGQREGERIVIASEPIRAAIYDRKTRAAKFDGCQDLFLLDRVCQKLWLRAIPGAGTGLWDNEFKWAFVLP